MYSQPKILECVPNFSEGKNRETINAIAEAIKKVEGQSLLHIDPSPSANRTVFTFAGNPEAVIEAAFEAIKTAAQLIDMRQQSGVHPRLGSTDVCPLIPLKNMSMDEAVALSHKLALKVADNLPIPIFMYEFSAKGKYRKSLPQIRKGQYEGLQQKLLLPEWQPDYNYQLVKDWEAFAASGATIIGARNILVAFNISLNTKDAAIAQAIAEKLRSLHGGLLPATRAIGWYLADFDCAQVSMNLLDYRITSPLKAWETCKEVAKAYDVVPIGCELVGLIPEVCLLEAGNFALKRENIVTQNKDQIVQAGIKHLKLNHAKAFLPEQDILEKALRINTLE